MNQQRYAAYRTVLSKLHEWRSAGVIEAQAHEELRDAAEGLLLARRGADAEEPLASASTTVLQLLNDNELNEPNASWLLDSLLACGPRMRAAEAA